MEAIFRGPLLRHLRPFAPASMGPKRTRGQTTTSTSTSTSAAAKAASKKPKAPAHAQYFLMKSEVDVFSIDDLAKVDQEPWDGVRNHAAKNIQKSMRTGDLAFFWGSNTKEPGIMGVVEVVREAFPDETQFDPKSKYFDKTSSRDDPRWWNVSVRLKKKLERPVLLKDLKGRKELEDMPLFKMSRLSVQTVPPAAWAYICGSMNNEELEEFM